MATIQNDRDVLLQGTAIRVIPVVVPITIADVTGLQNTINVINSNTKRIRITSNYDVLYSNPGSGSTTPSSVTLIANLEGGLTGTVSWSISGATLSPSGNTATFLGTTVSASTVKVTASLSGVSESYIVSVTGALAAQNTINLASQVTGQLAAGGITGLGALALLNTVNLNTQTVGALNGATQVTNLGTLAYANAIAANQIGAGTLAAGVIYAGTINADNITTGTLTGISVKGTAAVYVEGTTLGTASAGMYAEASGYGVLMVKGRLNVFHGAIDMLDVHGTSFDYGRISSGNTATFRGASFQTNMKTVSYPDIYANKDEINLRSAYTSIYDAGGNLLMSAMTAKVQMHTNYIQLKSLGTKPPSPPDGAICFYDSGLCFATGGNWYKPTSVSIV